MTVGRNPCPCPGFLKHVQHTATVAVHRALHTAGVGNAGVAHTAAAAATAAANVTAFPLLAVFLVVRSFDDLV
jgi:hypothetical protein